MLYLPFLFQSIVTNLPNDFLANGEMSLINSRSFNLFFEQPENQNLDPR